MIKTELIITKRGKNVKLRENLTNKYNFTKNILSDDKNDVETWWDSLLPTKNIEIFKRYNGKYRDREIDLDIYEKTIVWFKFLSEFNKRYVMEDNINRGE